MYLKDLPIQWKLMAVILTTTSAALVVSCLGFISYEIFTLHKNMARALETRADIIAANLAATQGLHNQAVATAVLNALQKDPRMVEGCIYDGQNKIYAKYPANAPDASFPVAPGEPGSVFGSSFLTVFYPINKNGTVLGTVYLESNLTVLTDRYYGYATLSAVILASSMLAAYLLSRILQKEISQPIRSLAETSNLILKNGNYSARAVKYGNDELGSLTENFNQMLNQIEEQSRSLQQFAAIVESSDDAIISKTPGGVITSWNPGAEKLFGHAAHEAVGQALPSLVPADRVHEESKIFQRIKDGELIENFETVRIKKNGGAVDIAASMSPIKDGGGNVISVSMIARNITEQKKAREKIRRLNNELEQRVLERTAELEAANRELEAFSYTVSHDLRAPLRAVDGFSQAVEEDYGSSLPEEGRRHLRTIREGAQRMGVLIDDLLTFSRLSRKPLNLHEVDSNKLINDVIEELNPGQYRHPIDIRLGKLFPCQGDEALMKQVWINLLSNAFKYSSKRESALVEVGNTPDTQENIYFVRDNGTGFDMRYAHKLFGVFQRLHRADEFDGTGVGLAIVQRIVHRHGGRVWATSAPDQGATFYFTIKGAAKT